MTAGVKVLQKGLTLEGIAHAFALGTLLYGAFGAGGFSLLCLYFLFGTAVSVGRTALLLGLDWQQQQQQQR
jgi:uncharacterized membrane protein